MAFFTDYEQELTRLIVQAQRLPCDHLEQDKDWTKEELTRAKKMYYKIDQLQSSAKITSTSLFNEARDCCDMLQQWMKRLEMNLLQTNYHSYNSLIDLGRVNKQTSTY